MTSGLMIAAPSSGSGKTVLTLALLRALKNKDVSIASAKAGPDYIDPAFHAIASGVSSINLDPWAMDEARIQTLAHAQAGENLLVEAMMGLYDGAADGSGSAANLAKQLDIPVVLVVDAAKQSHSIAALVRGFRDYDREVNFAGVLLNKVGSARHEKMLREALAAIDVNVFGAIPRDEKLALPERHLGLVQAGEITGIEAFIEGAANLVAENCDLDAIANVFSSVQKSNASGGRLPPLGQHIAVARDEAFAFCYPHLLADWRAAGAALSFFSPLEDEAPNETADVIYLPGGYPELNLEKLSAAVNFKSKMRSAKEVGKRIYGECGGYMVLGQGIVGKDGVAHEMCGLLNLQTSFEKRKLHLGYRRLMAQDFVFGDQLMAHEFHYTSAIREEGKPLFEATDALGESLGNCGLRDGNVMGSYMHIIDGAAS